MTVPCEAKRLHRHKKEDGTTGLQIAHFFGFGDCVPRHGLSSRRRLELSGVVIAFWI